MKLVPGIFLVVLGTVLIAFSVLIAYKLPSSFGSRTMLIAFFLAGGAFEFLGARDLLRAK
jgi:hypothetical protein